MTEQELQAIIHGVSDKLGGKLDQLNTHLTTLVNQQPEMAGDLKKTIELMGEIQRLPVNNIKPPRHGNELGGNFL